MSKKDLFRKFKKNTIILIGAAFVALGVFFISKNPEIFTASILSLQEKAFITEKGWDIAYKTNSGAVDIFLAENMEIPQKIEFTISYDKDDNSIDTENISGQGEKNRKQADEGSIIITTIPNNDMDKNQSLIILPFSGNQEDILLSEAIATFTNEKNKNLSIGSLNNITSHSK